MTPLVGLTVFGYMFLIATCLTVWAALTLRDGSRSRRAAHDDEAPARELTGLPTQRRVERLEARPARAAAVESVPLRSGLPEVTPRDPAEGTGNVRPVADLGREPRREPGRTITARKLVVSETSTPTGTGLPPVELERSHRPDSHQPRLLEPSEPKEPAAERRVSNDDVRGAKAVVKQRSLDDAFDRFIEVDRKDRGF